MGRFMFIATSEKPNSDKEISPDFRWRRQGGGTGGRGWAHVAEVILCDMQGLALLSHSLLRLQRTDDERRRH